MVGSVPSKPSSSQTEKLTDWPLQVPVPVTVRLTTLPWLTGFADVTQLPEATVQPGAGEGEAEAIFEGEGLTEAAAEGDGDGATLGEALGAALGDAEGAADGEGDGAILGDGLGATPVILTAAPVTGVIRISTLSTLR